MEKQKQYFFFFKIVRFFVEELKLNFASQKKIILVFELKKHS